MRAKTNFRLIVMIATDKKVFLNLNWIVSHTQAATGTDDFSDSSCSGCLLSLQHLGYKVLDSTSATKFFAAPWQKGSWHHLGYTVLDNTLVTKFLTATWLPRSWQCRGYTVLDNTVATWFLTATWLQSSWQQLGYKANTQKHFAQSKHSPAGTN